MKNISDKSVDMILCDLPYGITKNKWDSVINFDNLWMEYKRIIKDNGAIVLFAEGMFMADLMESNKNMWRYNLVWDKIIPSGFLNANKMPLKRAEQILVFYKKLPIYNPQMELGEKSHSKGRAVGKISYSGKKNNNYGDYCVVDNTEKLGEYKYPTSILKFKKIHPSKCLHPTQKPVELLEYLIKTYTNEEMLVLDNCMGSGSTGVACVNTNRNFLGIELDKNYFDIADQRIQQALYGADKNS